MRRYLNLASAMQEVLDSVAAMKEGCVIVFVCDRSTKS
jgi:hypothetical protein